MCLSYALRIVVFGCFLPRNLVVIPEFSFGIHLALQVRFTIFNSIRIVTFLGIDLRLTVFFFFWKLDLHFHLRLFRLFFLVKFLLLKFASESLNLGSLSRVVDLGDDIFASEASF